MEFVDRIFGTKRRKQEKPLTEIGISSELRKELVGPEPEEASVIIIDNEKFLDILKSGEHEKVLSHLVSQSDTHQYYELYNSIQEHSAVYCGDELNADMSSSFGGKPRSLERGGCHMDIGEGVKVKTGVASIDYSGQRTLFSDLNEMSFKYSPKESKNTWSVYEIERV